MLALSLFGAAASCQDSEQPPVEAVAAENTKPGTLGWSSYGAGLAAAGDLALWANPYVANAGDSLDVYLTALHGPVQLGVVRLGWYGGDGGRLLATVNGIPSDSQPPCTGPAEGPIACPWHRSLRLATGPQWTSGVLVLKATDALGHTAFYPLVLRDRRPSPFVIVVPQLTMQAYNAFGGQSLYTAYAASPGGRIPHVSFERPYSGQPLSSNFLAPLHWIEKSGYDATYISDADLALNRGPALDDRRVIIFLGHDEYWTWGMRDLVEEARNSGSDLVFLEANNAYWNARLEPGVVTGRPGQVITCWRSALDPGATGQTDVTTRFRDPPLNRPENALVGVMYETLSGHGTRPLVAADSGVGPEAERFLAEAGLAAGDTLTHLVGGEGDRIVANGWTPEGLQVVFRSPFIPAAGRPHGVYHTTFYVARSGAGVFAAGNNEFPLGLEPSPTVFSNPKLQELMAAVVSWMDGDRWERPIAPQRRVP